MKGMYRGIKARSIYPTVPLLAFRHVDSRARLFGALDARKQFQPPENEEREGEKERARLGGIAGKRKNALSPRNERIPLIRSVRGK